MVRKRLKHTVYSKKIGHDKLVENYEALFTDKILPNMVDSYIEQIANSNVFFFKPTVTNAGQLIIYFHGGFFQFGSQKAYSSFCASVSHVCQSIVALPPVAQASEKHFPFQLEHAYACYQYFLRSPQYASCRFVLAGDGTGANLAISLAMYLKERNVKMPEGLALISPFVDMNVQKKKSKDPLLTTELLENYAAQYAGPADRNNPLLSPLLAPNAKLQGLPPVFIQANRSELLFEQSTLLQERLVAAGVACELQGFSKTWHLFQMFPDACDDAHNAVDEFGKKIQGLFTHPSDEAMAQG